METRTEFWSLGWEGKASGTCALVAAQVKDAYAVGNGRGGKFRLSGWLGKLTAIEMNEGDKATSDLCGCETRTPLADSGKKRKGSRYLKLEQTSPHLLFGTHDQRLDAKQDQFPFRSTGITSGNWQEAETCMVQACHTPWLPLQNHTSTHLEGWATPPQQGKCWMDIKKWTSLRMPGLLTSAPCTKDWKKLTAESSLVSSRWLKQPRDRTEANWIFSDWIAWNKAKPENK